VPTGGAIVASYLAGIWDLPLVTQPKGDCLVVDDLVDSGRTLQPYAERGFKVDALYRKPHSPADLAPDATLITGWVRFPWETDHAPTDAVTRLLQYVGEDVNREGLADTPRRYVKALAELTRGYREDPRAILSRTFSEDIDEMVVVKGIEFHSLCEHHILPFHGIAHVAYLPNDRVVGLSKIPRLVHCYARRLQIQERLTSQVADAIMAHLQPQGVGVIVRAHHSCMSMRGVGCHGDMVTSTLLGSFQHTEVRAEFLRLIEV
jgi:GTP cyclohydrolase I